MIVLGIDAGGTKAQFSVCDGEGHVICTIRRPAMSLLHCGEAGLREALWSGASEALRSAGCPSADPQTAFAAVCFGVPAWGESIPGDAAVCAIAEECFGDTPRLLCNDSQVAWAASLAMKPGINVVAGTGTIAFGVDPQGKEARCGGWGYHCSDEGSGYWLGKRLISLFCKQSDGRIPHRGPLYDLIHERFEQVSDFEIHDLIWHDYMPYRDKVASLQLLLLEAARRGDADAIEAYREAGAEIALNVRGLLSMLDFPGAVDVSYSGGIFNVGELIMGSFRAALEDLPCRLTRPLGPPWIGSLMLALRLVHRDQQPAIDRLLSAQKEA